MFQAWKDALTTSGRIGWNITRNWHENFIHEGGIIVPVSFYDTVWTNSAGTTFDLINRYLYEIFVLGTELVKDLIDVLQAETPYEFD